MVSINLSSAGMERIGSLSNLQLGNPGKCLCSTPVIPGGTVLITSYYVNRTLNALKERVLIL